MDQQGREPEAYHWVNVFVGLLDSVFHLAEEEQFMASSILSRLLAEIRVGSRPVPERLPAALALEIDAGFYTIAMSRPRENATDRPVRQAGADDPVVSVEAWSQAFVDMLVVAYPDLTPMERILSTKVFADVLTAIGVPRRAAAHTPDDVLRAYLSTDVEP